MANNDLIRKNAPGITFSSPEARAVYARLFQVRAKLSQIRGQQVSWFQLLSEMAVPYEKTLSEYEKPIQELENESK
jgi:hypothetical protein